MSAVHDEIAMQALSVQSVTVQEQFKDYINDFKDSSWYPDVFADRSMSKAEKDKIDPEADRFIYPLPPETAWHKRFDKLAEECHSYSGASPFPMVYLVSFYLGNAVECLQQGDIRSAIKFCGVYSHVIGDTGEPVHAMSPAMLDIVVPPPHEFLGLELHANVEGLKAPVDIAGYEPRLLGSNLKQAEMGSFEGLIKSHKLGAAQATPIVQALYAKDVAKAMALSSVVQSDSAKHFADFIFTVFSIAGGNIKEESHYCDLCEYPYISNSVDMLYRYQPIVDVSLVPYSGGKMEQLSLLDDDGSVVSVHGLGVVPSLGPPFTDDHIRNVDIEFFLVPGAYSKFSAKVGLNPLFKESMPTAKFQVLSGGEVITESDIIKPGDVCQTIMAELGDTRFLTLRMNYVHTPSADKLNSVSSHLAWTSHGVWGVPRLK